MSNPTSPEQRQHINISQYAYEIIRNDSINFLGKLNVSGFINTVIENSMLESFEDLSLTEKERIDGELSQAGITLSNTEEKVITKIANAHQNFLIHSLKQYDKDKVLKIRLNQNVYHVFYPDNSEWFGKKAKISQGEYIKMIIEEYARKTYFDRESIFLKQKIERLEDNISSEGNNKRILEITLKTTREKYYCKLYRLSEQYETNYHYLIGLFKNSDSTEYKIASMRLSRIADFKTRGRSLGSGRITKTEGADIDKKIKMVGIPYLVGKPEKFEISLTKDGMTLYDSIYSQRPIYDAITDNGNDTYTMIITATERQIQNYFFAFGKEALIISPNKTKDWMEEKLTAAIGAYSDS